MPMDFQYKSFDKFTWYGWLWSSLRMLHKKWNDCRIKYSAFINNNNNKKREFIIAIEFILLMQPKATHGRLFIQCANDAFEKSDSPLAHWNRDSYRSSLRAWMLHVHIKGNWLSIRFLLCLEWIMLLDVEKCFFKDECKQAYSTKFIACTQHKGCQKAHRLAQLPKMNLPEIFIICSSLIKKTSPVLLKITFRIQIKI